MGYEFIIIILSTVVVLAAQIYLKRQYAVYKEIPSDRGMTGGDAARYILDKNGLSEIKVTTVAGELTDHYSPNEKVIRLSSDIFHGKSIASVSVAAHECGHAIQYKNNYFPIKVRNAIVPFVNLCSKVGYIVLVIGVLASIFNIALIGIILLSATLVFQLITLPVEFDASRRAKIELLKEGIITDKEQSSVKKVLNAAALTYVASLISNLLEILRLFLRVNRNRD